MIGLDKFTEDYFLKYSTKPVKIKPYDPQQTILGGFYISKISGYLKGIDAEVKLRGSSLFKIAGKGEVEVGVYLDEANWDLAIKEISKYFGKPENIESNYVKFNDVYEGKENEIILLKGHEAEVDKKLHSYLVGHPKLLKEYAEVKKKYCFSKREYNIRKNDFLSSVISEIPEDYKY
ncbi:MAG: hypothetical protein NT141_02450 [candidate division WWE3 bacterium]|nr:hypothetical protein [candidate division WWE3 bacterium]